MRISKILKLVIVLCVLFFLQYTSCTLAGETDESKKILLNANFTNVDDVTEVGFKYSGNKNAKVVEKEGNRILKMSLDRFEDPISYRSEVTVSDLSEHDFAKGLYAYIGREYWYSVRIFIPKDWQFDDDNEIILQWHTRPDFDLGENWRNPPISLMIGKMGTGIGMNYLLVVHADKKRITPKRDSYNRYTFSEKYILGGLVNDLGRWNEWVFRIKWSFTDNGRLTVWKNGEQLLDLKNQANTFNDYYGPYFKLGIYKWSWKKMSGSCDRRVDKRVIFYDDIKIWKIDKPLKCKQ